MAPDRIIAAGTCHFVSFALLGTVTLCRLRLPVTGSQAKTTRKSFLRTPFLHPRVAADLNSPAATHEGTRLSQRL